MVQLITIDKQIYRCVMNVYFYSTVYLEHRVTVALVGVQTTLYTAVR